VVDLTESPTYEMLRENYVDLLLNGAPGSGGGGSISDDGGDDDD
jgi:hypothetical protein